MGVNELREYISVPYAVHQKSVPIKSMNRWTMYYINRNSKYTGVTRMGIMIRCKKIAISGRR